MKTLTQIALVVLMIVLVPTLASASLSVGDANYVGYINNGIPSGDAAQASYINFLTSLAAGAGPTQLPPGTGETYDRIGSTIAGPFAAAATPGTTYNNTFSVNLTETFQYVLAKYDGPNYGSVVWYFPAGITGLLQVPALLPGPNQYDVSHISLYNKITTVVPEPGTIAVWGLLAVAGYFGAKKYQAKA